MKRFLLVGIALFAAAPAYADTIPIKISYSSPIAPEEFAIPMYPFFLPEGSWHISLNITTFSVDDRGVLLLNNAITSASTGIGGPGWGQMVLTEHGPSSSYYFQYGNAGPFQPITNLFVTGWNELSLIVNNTGYGIAGALTSVGSSSATLIGTVTYDLGGPVPPPGPGEVPLPGALPLFATGLGTLGLLGWRRKRKAQEV